MYSAWWKDTPRPSTDAAIYDPKQFARRERLSVVPEDEDMNRMTMRWLSRAALVLAAALAAPALAALATGGKAPDFTLQATLGGNVFTFSLADALKKGPVVLYFYPAAFTTGCTIEAHEFADAIDQYKALGATVIGVSHDPLDKLQEIFGQRMPQQVRGRRRHQSVRDESVRCGVGRSIPQYANRTSYVIAPDGTIVYTYTSLDPSLHVQNTLTALKAWKADHAAQRLQADGVVLAKSCCERGDASAVPASSAVTVARNDVDRRDLGELVAAQRRPRP